MSRFSLLVVAAMVAMSALTVSANLLLNPSFETAGAGGSWDPANWSRNDGTDRTDINSWGDPWYAQDGSWAIKMNNFGGNPGDHSMGQEVAYALPVGAPVTFSFYVFRNNAPTFDDAYLDLGLMTDGDDTWISHLSFASGLSNQTWDSGWVQYSFTVTNQATLGVNAIQAWINVKNVNSASGTDLLFDSASLTIPEPTVAGLLGFSGLLIAALRRKAKARK